MADARVSLIPQAPEGLSQRARYFVEQHGLRVPHRDLKTLREAWLEQGIPAAEIDRAVAFQERWGGLALPPALEYEGGPRVLETGAPEGSAANGWRFPAGGGRISMAHGFMIGPGGEFGIDADYWTPLHASTEGWVEALALANHAGYWAKTITKISGSAVEELNLDGFEPVPEVQGLADNWWRGKDSLIAIYRGEAIGFNAPHCLRAHLYGGLDAWGLAGI
ncbi:hypothetical protein [Streptomyces longwoodensis]|uniref:hypothetical protein n=1 Tax=Streptomyces longwoodensis TaxID=68231 RepID=UPI00381F6029